MVAGATTSIAENNLEKADAIRSIGEFFTSNCLVFIR